MKISGSQNSQFSRPKVGILLTHGSAHSRGIAEGVAAYVREKANWEVFLADHTASFPGQDLLRDWDGDGLLLYHNLNQDYLELTESLSSKKVFLHNLEDVPADAGKIWNDDRQVGRLGAQSLIEQGFESFAFIHDKRYLWSQLRLEGFAEVVEEHNFKYETFSVPVSEELTPTWVQDYRNMLDWVKALRPPTAVFCCNDLRGQQLLEACRHVNVRVPDQITVLGVDNDELLCRLTTPSLSSVQTETRRIGYTGAQLLDEMLAGKPAPKTAIEVPPAGIVDRGSTDITAVKDPLVSQALIFIRENACRGIKVGEVLQHLKVSRRLLESRFSRLLGYTPHEAIQRVRFRRVRELLANTKLTLEEIAAMTGFQHVEYLSASFKKWAGQPPSAYRAEQQAKIAARPQSHATDLAGAFK
jgi:LacI family transcriptional regulator